jgi:hypothetical protein
MIHHSRRLDGGKVDNMGQWPATSDPAKPAGAGSGEATQTFLGGDPVIGPGLAGPASPPLRPPTEVVPVQPPTEAVPTPPPTEAAPPRQPTEAAPPWQPAEAAPPWQPAEAAPPWQPAEIVRYGPGVPAAPAAGQAGLTAESVWRTGQPPAPPRRRPRLRQLFGSALTVILLAASGVVLYLRFHHAPFHVTGVVISEQTRATCGVDVTGRIATNGAAGTVSYQWLFQPDRQPPQPLSQSVTAGQHAIYVTIDVEGSGHGVATQTVTLQVLGPDPRTASAPVALRC